MLVLTRKVGERILAGEDIEITVVSVRGDQVRLGITAPREVSICRSELADQVRRENAAAARAAAAIPGKKARGTALSAADLLKTRHISADNKDRNAEKRQTPLSRERRRAQQ